ncbi:hypothetical protein THOD04_120099 [Vibrio owensii]|nr:hypothetical protein THOD04_120099 [Vibrio owensii]
MKKVAQKVEAGFSNLGAQRSKGRSPFPKQSVSKKKKRGPGTSL